MVLSFNAGFRRDYARDPYGDWQLNRRLALVVQAKQTVKIYPFSALKRAGSSLTDDIGGEQLTIVFNSRDQTAVAQGLHGEQITHFVAFLADARAFYPDAAVFKQR